MSEWYRFTAKNPYRAGKIRAAFTNGASRVVREGGESTLVQVRSGESNWLQKVGREHGINYSNALAPPEVIAAPCGVELAGKSTDSRVIGTHSKHCNSCRRLQGNKLEMVPVEEAIARNTEQVTAVKTEVVLAQLGQERDRALNISADLDAAISAVRAIQEHKATLAKLEREIASSKEALRTFFPKEQRDKPRAS